ncbi:DUF2779 domain-containing protein [Candidatus Woesearchaeota archaeon]|nr:DUF2779 domain-containing protein [Candidatus Woesearchaeota archaeon]
MLSKSKYLIGLHCPRQLWCVYNAPDMIPPVDDATQALFDQGHEVGAFAKKLYPLGIEVEWDKGFNHTLTRTKELVVQRKTIFEASFIHGDAYCRVDILVPVDGDWDLIEVKSSTQVTEEHLHDVAFQRYCLEGAGIRIRRCHLMHVNSEYVRHGDIDPQQLFSCEDVTEQVTSLLPSVENNLNDLMAIIQGPMPHPQLGTECIDPKDCPVCMTGLPDHNVTELYQFGKRAYAFLNQNTTLITDLPDHLLNQKQRIQRDCIQTGQAHTEPAHIKEFLAGLHYPLYLLDFEAVNPAVPLFDGTHPYQQVPFQLSLHIIQQPGSTPDHVAFLADSPEDPRRAVVDTLRAIRSTGTVLAYNKMFEQGILRDLLDTYPEEKWLASVIERLDDLLIPFRNFWYYHPAQHGSCSIKAVLPALTGKSYNHLEVSKGDQAAREFLQMTYKERKQNPSLRKALLMYCKQDTEGMIALLHCLEQVAMQLLR